MTQSVARLVPAALCALAAVGPARADYFYGWSADTPLVISDHSGMAVGLTAGGNPAALTGPASGPQSVVAATLSTFVNAGVTGTDTFSHGKSLALGLQVVDGTDSEKVRFAIGVSGSLTAGGANDISYSFADGLTRDLTVNGHHFHVALDASHTGTGEILATITPDAASGGGSSGGGPPPSTAPEPSALVLAAVGTASLAVCCRAFWRRLRPARLVA